MAPQIGSFIKVKTATSGVPIGTIGKVTRLTKKLVFFEVERKPQSEKCRNKKNVKVLPSTDPEALAAFPQQSDPSSLPLHGGVALNVSSFRITDDSSSTEKEQLEKEIKAVLLKAVPDAIVTVFRFRNYVGNDEVDCVQYVDLGFHQKVRISMEALVVNGHNCSLVFPDYSTAQEVATAPSLRAGPGGNTLASHRGKRDWGHANPAALPQGRSKLDVIRDNESNLSKKPRRG